MTKSAVKIVNDVMVWLNERYGCSEPVLPLRGWSSTVIKLWHQAVDWLPGSNSLPTSIVVYGSWQPFDDCNFTVTNILITFREAEGLPPSAPPAPSAPAVSTSTPERQS